MYRISKVLPISLILLSACTSESPVDKLRWLEGSWKQATVKNNRSSTESWEYDAGELKGVGISRYGADGVYDTLLMEKLRIIVRDQELFYESSLPLKDATIYRLTDSGEDFWTFSNPQASFPKTITYQKTKNGFSSIVGDGTRSVQLDFIRQ